MITKNCSEDQTVHFGKVSCLAPGEVGDVPEPLLYTSRSTGLKAEGILEFPYEEAAQPKPEPEPGSSTVVEVGIMDVEVGTGPDEELGTEDDEVEIKPRPKSKPKKEKGKKDE